MADYAQFDQDKIDAALDAARRHNETFKLQAPGSAADLSAIDMHASGEFSVSGGCITVSVQNHQICLDIPLVGKYCLPVPSWIPDGASLQACISLCTTWGIPHGVKLTVSFNGTVIFTKTFLKC
ncbi:hypothetical protein [Stakelama pacifica]|uniref:Uncharacterized protein n=1 Tax=Stakelama pacifica TaxID=517720 RepID=A0A4R6FCX0_9SPHN|nr:hypothetical protein [Stakelama pacifica]MAX01135.1 hypothetical protein [Sphingomonas sp.]TDN79046.1 hypothetical protein EV664_11482 [Stakelama pacifica]GGO98761.1 hypothetical protein GCM10011329_30670 [Stakelama pacifica]